MNTFGMYAFIEDCRDAVKDIAVLCEQEAGVPQEELILELQSGLRYLYNKFMKNFGSTSQAPVASTVPDHGNGPYKPVVLPPRPYDVKNGSQPYRPWDDAQREKFGKNNDYARDIFAALRNDVRAAVERLAGKYQSPKAKQFLGQLEDRLQSYIMRLYGATKVNVGDRSYPTTY